MSKALLIVTALVEAATGVALVVVPSRVVELLLGEGLSSSPSLVLGRVTGFALVALGVACWLARGDTSGARKSLVSGMLVYNLAVPALLVHAALALSLQGIMLWPAVVLHAALAVWCVARLRRP